MSKYADRLMQYIEEHPGSNCNPQKRDGQPQSRAARYLCVSRTSFDWDPHLSTVVYVPDATTNFLGYDVDGAAASNSRNIGPPMPFILFMAHLLTALGVELPKQVGHPWLLVGEAK